LRRRWPAPRARGRGKLGIDLMGVGDGSLVEQSRSAMPVTQRGRSRMTEAWVYTLSASIVKNMFAGATSPIECFRRLSDVHLRSHLDGDVCDFSPSVFSGQVNADDRQRSRNRRPFFLESLWQRALRLRCSRCDLVDGVRLRRFAHCADSPNLNQKRSLPERSTVLGVRQFARFGLRPS
jgi:hypothetical protein